MKTLYAIPSAIDCSTCFKEWKGQGYYTAAAVEIGEPLINVDFCDYIIYFDNYLGYPWAINLLVKNLLLQFNFDWIVTGGHDVFPHSSVSAQELGNEFFEHFNKTTNGVVQPQGDTFNRPDVCWSPWLGRDYLLNNCEDLKPYCEEYFHFYSDQEVFDVANKKNLLYLPQNITHYHKHWTRETKDRKCPKYLINAHNELITDGLIYATRRKNNLR